jgi:class I fructose-bisphosphate aldolase
MKKRVRNLMREDGKTFILAMDHAMLMDVGMKLKDPRKVVASAMQNGADTLLTTIGAAEYCIDEIGTSGLLIRGDLGSTATNWNGKPFTNSFATTCVDRANRLGADGIVTMLFTHMLSGQEEETTAERCAHIADQCNTYGLAYCVEAVPGGFVNPEVQNIDTIGFAARLACELGADIVKSVFVNDENYRKRVVETCYRPLVVLGGGSKKTDKEVLASTKAAMDAGCKGVAYGRVVWNHKDIGKMCRAISMIIHEDATVEEALAALQ